MEKSIYSDIAKRTGGDIYIGVVGPVRSGKSTFIKRFMEALVIPNISDGETRKRAVDELPQSASGKTVMTTEPKFIPETAVNIQIGESASMSVKMIDCVGYVVEGALGSMENGEPRMVHTPWSDEPMPFEQAAELGTQKVICEHSTVGLVITTDGSIGEIGRESYVAAEERVISELAEKGKPFAVVLNTFDPEAAGALELAATLTEKYGVPVIPANCTTLCADDISRILEQVLLQFPVKEIAVDLPSWINGLESGHWLKKAVWESVLSCASQVTKAKDIRVAFEKLSSAEYVKCAKTESIDLGTGKARLKLELCDGLLYKVISEKTGCEINGDDELIAKLEELCAIEKKYKKVEKALADVYSGGYGIVTPDVEDLRLEEPQIVQKPEGYGVKLKASAPSVHMIMAQIETEVSPIVGTEKQSEELVKYLLKEFEEDPKKIWESNIFGKNLHELVNEGLHAKLSHMPDDARSKLSDTLQKIINEGSGGLICILL